MSRETRVRLYRGQPVRHRAGDHAEFPDGQNFTDCPYAALAYARGTRGVVLVLDLPAEDGPPVYECLWSLDGTGPRRFAVHGLYDEWIVAQVPAKALRAALRGGGRGSLPDTEKSWLLVREIKWRAEALGESDRYVRTGESDVLYAAWPGDVLSRAHLGREDLATALAAEVRRRSARRRGGRAEPRSSDDVCARLAPMVRGLFPQAEQSIVLEHLERSVVIVQRDNIYELIREISWPDTAWSVANLFLCSVGAPLLGPTARACLGLSANSVAYVSTELFTASGLFDDFVVHEAAHMLHDGKRRLLGLPGGRRREWLVEVAFKERETFAYACEAYSRIVARARGPKARIAEADEYARDVQFPMEAVDTQRVSEILREACAGRAGWKVIRARCAP